MILITVYYYTLRNTRNGGGDILFRVFVFQSRTGLTAGARRDVRVKAMNTK